MGVETGIQWCDHTWNPVRGCQKVSPGCANCYAETQSKRNPRVLGEWGPNGMRAVAAESYWGLPSRWAAAAEEAGERRRVFCASLADWLEDHPAWEGPRRRLLSTIRTTPGLDWLLLTKRPQDWRPLLTRAQESMPLGSNTAVMLDGWLYGHRAPANVWLGASVEDRARKDRIDRLREIPAAVRFLSLEPLLEDLGTLNLSGIDWVIAGGESGPDARPCNLEWIRSIVQQCQAAGVACFVKQLGSRPFDSFYRSGVTDQAVHLRDKKGGDPWEWPKGLRVREFPEVARAAGERT